MKIEKFVSDKVTQNGAWEELPDGRIRMPVTLTRTGIFKYLYSDIFGKEEHPDFPRHMFQDGIINVYRSPEEVLSETSLKTMKGMWFTDGHPPEIVTIDNYQKYSKGMIGDDLRIREEKYDNHSIFFVDAYLTLTDKKIKEKIDSGINQVSLGYTAFFDFQPGEFAGINYHTQQLGIENNHTALEPKGRAGSKVNIKSRLGDLDTIYEIENGNIIDNKKEKIFIMDLKGIKIEFKDSNSEKLVENELKDKDSVISDLKDKIKVIDSLNAKLIKLEKDLQDAQSVDYEAIAEERTATINKACAYIKDAKPEQFKGKSVLDIQKITVTDAYKGKDLSNVSEGTFKELFNLLDDKPASITNKPLIRDSFTGVGGFSVASLNDTDSVFNDLSKMLVNAGNPKKEEK